LHELGLIAGILKTVESAVAREKLSRVGKIVLQVGEFSGVVPSYLKEYFPAAVRNTRFEGTELEVEIIPGIARCNSCGAEFNAFENRFQCPGCGGKEMSPQSGREFLIKEIEAY